MDLKPVAYDVNKSINKSMNGGIDGAIATVVAVLVIGLMKKFLDLTPENETLVASAVGVIVAAVVVAAKRFVGNWLKHKEPVVTGKDPQ